jgi:hypothetical protein
MYECLYHQKQKIMNVFKSILALAVFSLLSFPVLAQGPGERGPRRANPEQLREALDLSEEQMEVLKPIFEETRNQMEALREQAFEDRNDRRSAAQKIMEGQKEKMANVLTEAQLRKLEEMRPKRGTEAGPGKRGGRPGAGAQRGQNEELHKALQDYRSTNIDPVLRKQRMQLEADLSAEDKATITALRAKRDAHRTMMKQAKEKGERPVAPTDAQKEEQKANRAAVKALVEKYDARIEALLGEVEPQADQWKNDIKSIHEKYRPEDAPKGRQGGRNKAEQSRGSNEQEMRKANFLLMNPVG